MLLIDERTNGLDRIGDDLGERNDFDTQLNFTPADARHVEQVINQSFKVLDLPLDRCQFLTGVVFARPGLLQQVQGRLDRS